MSLSSDTSKKWRYDMIRFIVSVILVLGAVVGAIFLEGFTPKVLMGFSAFLIVAGVPVFSSFGIWKINEVFTAWKDPFVKQKAGTFAVSLKILEFQEKLFYISGMTGTIIGFILVLNTIQGQAVDQIGRSFAASLIAVLYGLIFAVLIRILRARIEYAMMR